MSWLLGMMLTGSAVLWVFIWARLRSLERTFPPLDAATSLPDPPAGWPFVTALVPARNEALDIAAALGSLLAQDYPRWEVILVDDQSTDDTARIAEEIGRAHRGFRLIRGAARPSEEWVGKNWALTQGLSAARGEWLLFVDADVVLHPAALKRAMAWAALSNAAVVSILPAIECRTISEKILMPLFALFSALVEPLDAVNQPTRPGSRLSGAFILTQRAPYEAVGGHRAVAAQIVEDLALARNLKRSGQSLWLTWTHDLVRTRMYDTFRDWWLGLSRSSYPMLRYSPFWLLTAWVAAAVGALAPWVALVWGTAQVARGDMLGAPLAITAAALCAASPYVLRKVFEILRVSPFYAWLLPVASLIYCLAATWSAACHYTGRGLSWKKRVYRPAPPRAR